jgi:alpha-beta hydrolase superfamily lysophospholipase
VLHGGRVESHESVTAFQPAVLRVTALARALHRRVAAAGIEVVSLRFGVRGWNGTEASPVVDACWALERLRWETGLPVVVVGHSMGGRAALRVAGDSAVRGVVALAPWLPEQEPVRQLAGRQVVLLHGSADRITDPHATARYAERIAPIAASVRLAEVPGAGHAMLHNLRKWHMLTADAVLDVLADATAEPLRRSAG